MNSSRKNLLESLKQKGVLNKPQIVSAFENIDRADFVLPEYREMAYIDEALPILGGQTISQPYTVAFMLDLLDPKPGDKILDIGAGSGWQTALLAYIVGHAMANRKCGKVYAVELIDKLCKFGMINLSKYDFIKQGVASWFCGNASKGLPEKAPFDGIIAAAALDGKIPQEWFDQLKVGGRLVAPINHSIWLFSKKSKSKIESKEHPGFVFVPFMLNKL